MRPVDLLTNCQLLVVRYNVWCAELTAVLFCVAAWRLVSTYPSLDIPRERLMRVCWRWLCGMVWSSLKLPQLLTASNISRSPVILSHFIFWSAVCTSAKRFKVNSNLALGAMLRCLSAGHCVDILGIPIGDHEKFFACKPLWWSDYDRSRTVFSPTHMGFAYHSTSVFHAERCGLLFHIPGTEHCFLLSSITTFLIGTGSVISCSWGCYDSFWVGYFTDNSGCCIPLSGGCRTIFRLTRFTVHFMESYLVFHRIRALDWEEKASVGCFPYIRSSGSVLDIPALRLQPVGWCSAMFKLRVRSE